MTTDKNSNPIETALEEAQASLEEVSTTEKVETKEEVKPKVKKETAKKECKTETMEKEKGEKEDTSPKEKPKQKPPSYKVSECIISSKKLFKCSPEVTAIALREAGKQEAESINVAEARKLVRAFLKREVK